tara:strand:+ start:768 stop:1268 length:501 start_codon:yes stop_codon:yes gene_type:complete
MDKILTIIIFIFIFIPIKAEEIIGHPKVIDGDTIHIEKFKIRLQGIDAPEIKQMCKKKFLEISSVIGISFKKNYNCGLISKKKLKNKINNFKIKCLLLSRDKYQRYLATCFKGKMNLNKWMVRNGYALAYKRYSKQYLKDEQFAMENKLGIWKGTFLRPEKWRKVN